MSYSRIAKKLAKAETIILDGGTGTDIQSRGVPMAGETWCAEANLSHPDVVRSVHEDYIKAGAEIVTANTYPTSPLLFNALGRDQDMLRAGAEGHDLLPAGALQVEHAGPAFAGVAVENHRRGLVAR